ncbi:MAG: peptidoglycan DD-metalloendopeptidase family protein [Bacteroidales bacterium]|nr:peptidoglycan DD-metalloendopeptidase family protein [Bacteroidales bacterium]
MSKVNGRILMILAVAAMFMGTFSCRRASNANETIEPVNDSIPPFGFWEEDFRRVDDKVRSGDTFSGLMNRLGMSSEDAYKLSQICDSTFDVRKLRAGNLYKAYYDSLSNDLKYVVYENNRIRRTIFHCADSLAVYTYDFPVQHVTKFADVSISSSLWNDMSKAGSSPALIMKLSDLYAWTVDFFGLQKGDRFRLIYSQTECLGDIISLDTIYFARFTRDSTDLYSVMFDQGDNGNLYWNEKGESMRRAFLKAPLEFKRISSGFSYARKHPVTGQIRAHTAVDYAAPMGTPVVALGDGTVISAGWAGGGGNTIKIRHNSVYTTSYMHLRNFATGIKAGTHVRQGEVIGYVGSTGTSTGPHLDFRVYQNGKAINPLTMESPSSEPIKEENKAALDSVLRSYQIMAEEFEAATPKIEVPDEESED